MSTTDRIISIVNYFKSNPASKVYQKMVCPRVKELDYYLDSGCNVEKFLKEFIDEEYIIVVGNSLPVYDFKRFDPFIYMTEHAATKDLIEDDERVVTMLEYIEMCIEYEKNH